MQIKGQHLDVQVIFVMIVERSEGNVKVFMMILLIKKKKLFKKSRILSCMDVLHVKWSIYY